MGEPNLPALCFDQDLGQGSSFRRENDTDLDKKQKNKKTWILFRDRAEEPLSCVQVIGRVRPGGGLVAVGSIRASGPATSSWAPWPARHLQTTLVRESLREKLLGQRLREPPLGRPLGTLPQRCNGSLVDLRGRAVDPTTCLLSPSARSQAANRRPGDAGSRRSGRSGRLSRLLRGGRVIQKHCRGYHPPVLPLSPPLLRQIETREFPAFISGLPSSSSPLSATPITGWTRRR